MLDSCMDIDKNSHSCSLTPSDFQQQLPFYPLNIGYFQAGRGYYTIRTGLHNYLLLVTVSGGGKLTVKKQTCILHPGTAVLVDCSHFQDYRTDPEKGNWNFYFIHFHMQSPEGYCQLLLKRLTPVHLNDLSQSISRLQKLISLCGENDAAACVMESHLISGLLTDMIRSAQEEKSSSCSRYDMARLAEYIRSNCEKDLHLEDFIRFSNISRYYLIRLFEQQTGISPCRYLHLCRISRAQMLLSGTELSVAKIAEQVGYQDATVFIRHFRSVHNMTPGEYRKESVRMQNGFSD